MNRNAAIYPQPWPKPDEPDTFNIFGQDGQFECDAFYSANGQVTELCVAGEDSAVVTEEIVCIAFRGAEMRIKICLDALNRPHPNRSLVASEVAAELAAQQSQSRPRSKPPQPPPKPTPTPEELGQGTLFGDGKAT